MLDEIQKKAIKDFCTKDSKELLFAYGILRGDDFLSEVVDGKPTVPFWNKRKDAEYFLKIDSKFSDCDVADMDVIYIVATQFESFERMGQYVGINWPEDRKEWWGQPASEVEDFIRNELHWPK
jgi:hypothetical protein